MKISKLFHWLYGFLMLLPVFAVGVKCGYVMLNKNAKDNYTGKYTYESTLSLTDLCPYNSLVSLGNVSTTSGYNILKYENVFSNDYFLRASGTNTPKYVAFNLSNLVNDNTNSFNTNIDLTSVRSVVFITGKVYFYNVAFENLSLNYDGNIYTFFNQNSSYNVYTFTVVDGLSLSFTKNDNYLYFFDSATSNKYYGLSNLVYFNSFIVDNTLSSVFYSAIDELDNVSFFSWAKNSFLAQPFMYIGNLFGIPNVHPIFTFLSYWCAISIIWLVFDLFMYMPLLVHKWIDKAKVE